MTMMSVANSLLGGLGLFLVGMWLMTDGLKLAAGGALRDLLQTYTQSRLRALTTGFIITALVQSSSAVTVATIGFANAGLLGLRQAVWVIFGSNVGTTMTGWLVALVGFKVNIEALALPLIGVGMLVRLSGVQSPRGAIGETIVGFGLFFLGIAILKDAFASLALEYQIPVATIGGPGGLVVYVLVGLLLTTLMQSSSAAMVITLGAAEGGVIPLEAAAAVVIGANLGTTTTALLAVWGATSIAKRVALGHILFNLLTASIATAIIIPMLLLVTRIQLVLSLPPAPATTLALFHTVFNVLGVLLMLPLGNVMIRFLEKRFVIRGDAMKRPLHLDQNVLEVPVVAMAALLKEVRRLGRGAIEFAIGMLGAAVAPAEGPASEQESIRTLGVQIGEFIASLGRTHLPAEIAAALPRVIQAISRYFQIIELSIESSRLQERIRFEDPTLESLVADFNLAVVRCLRSTLAPAPETPLPDLLQQLEDAYNAVKFAVLKAGSTGAVGIVSADNQLYHASLIRRMVRQAVKAEHSIAEVESALAAGTSPPVMAATG